MKTNRFDDILRRKLESIQPDFQDQDWEKWHTFQQHATPTFWQTYGHWLGYAVATLTTAVMVVLYSNQTAQNENLLKEMQALKQQVASQNPDVVPQVEPAKVPFADTVYIVERQNVYIDRPVSQKVPLDDIRLSLSNQEDKENLLNTERNELAEYQKKRETLSQGTLAVSENQSRPEDLRKAPGVPEGTLPATQPIGKSNKVVEASKSYDAERLDLGEIVALPTLAYSPPAIDVYRRLQSRIPQSAKTHVSGQRMVKTENSVIKKQKIEIPASGQKVEKAAEDERLLPNFGLSLPFRIGIGQQWE